MKKKNYVAPVIEVIDLEHEGVLAGSLNANGVEGPADMGHGGSMSSINYVGYNAGLANDVEEMISNLFTVKQ